MLLDLHTHSIKSDDGRAKVENYCKWIRKKKLPLDGFVLTEHRQFDSESDYRHLEDEYGLLILKASEVETDFGHVLVFGVNNDLLAALDFSDIRLPIEQVLMEAERCGAFAAPVIPVANASDYFRTTKSAESSKAYTRLKCSMEDLFQAKMNGR